MENKILNYLVLGFVFLILGTALIPTIATSTSEKTNLHLVVGENHNITSGFNITDAQVNESESGSNFTINYPPEGWEVTECPIVEFSLQNDTTVYTSGTDYNFYPASGLVQVLNTTTTDGNNNTEIPNGDLYVRYGYCADGYLNSGWGRTVLNLISGFFALALLGGALFMFYQVFRETGVLGK